MIWILCTTVMIRLMIISFVSSLTNAYGIFFMSSPLLWAHRLGIDLHILYHLLKPRRKKLSKQICKNLDIV